MNSYIFFNDEWIADPTDVAGVRTEVKVDWSNTNLTFSESQENGAVSLFDHALTLGLTNDEITRVAELLRSDAPGKGIGEMIELSQLLNLNLTLFTNRSSDYVNSVAGYDNLDGLVPPAGAGSNPNSNIPNNQPGIFHLNQQI